MDLYFFLKAPGFSSHITFSNFAPRLTGAPSVARYIHQAVPRGKQWHIRDLCAIAPGESLQLKAEDFPEQEQSSSLFFLSKDKLQGSFDQLKLEEEYKSWPNWRANLCITSPHTAVSYQGDYPHAMLHTKRGSLVSAGAFFQKGQGICNGLFLVNFTSEIREQTSQVRLSSIRSHKTLADFTIATNQVNYLDMEGIDFPPGELILVSSKDIFAIPIYFSYAADKTQMSLEHSHSPLEFMVFGEDQARFNVVRKMKAFWLDYAAKPN